MCTCRTFCLHKSETQGMKWPCGDRGNGSLSTLLQILPSLIASICVQFTFLGFVLQPMEAPWIISLYPSAHKKELGKVEEGWNISDTLSQPWCYNHFSSSVRAGNFCTVCLFLLCLWKEWCRSGIKSTLSAPIFHQYVQFQSNLGCIISMARLFISSVGKGTRF